MNTQNGGVKIIIPPIPPLTKPEIKTEITELIDSFHSVTSIKENNGIKLILTTENNIYSLYNCYILNFSNNN